AAASIASRSARLSNDGIGFALPLRSARRGWRKMPSGDKRVARGTRRPCPGVASMAVSTRVPAMPRLSNLAALLLSFAAPLAAAARPARGYDWWRVAESRAAGTGIDTADVIEGWVADAEPGDPILEPAMREVGLGRASDTGGKIWWAAIYAAPGPAAALASGA